MHERELFMLKQTLKDMIESLINETKQELKQKEDLDHSLIPEYDVDDKIANLAKLINDKNQRLNSFIYLSAWNQSKININEFIATLDKG